ncbi:Formamidopyrimidine-DNA glycosylase [Patulibacter medicamentivorans]|uniref:Formamidopyrimidine-DNA glycosylase n=1 Tax=Patulibacter medicamentivorans TaxID=1097667 RepID=H0E0R9_9ACTN|nr:DNA-formamidopyrimidine glycosylase family protein [Patulibacter medicamentivorans]EHN12683.1 Formamidopyrimidine-DNA glycosylase [Patulibacter medicamentivorans]
MPELPEIEATVRLLDAAVRGAEVDSARAPGLATMRTFAPSLDALAGGTCSGLRRRGKLLLVGFEGGGLEAPATLVLHLMSAGRLQLWEKRAGPRDRTVRLVVRLRGGADGFAEERELRLREFGTKQAAWGKLLLDDQVAVDETISHLGPEAWPDPPDLTELPPRRTLRGAIRDQRVIAGIGRTWADEILWTAKLAPLRRCGDLDDEQRARLRQAMIDVLGGALGLYMDGGVDPADPDGKPRKPLALPLPDKLPLPLLVHRRTGQPCPRDGTTLLAVHYEDDEMTYCPTCQTGGKPYKDRRLSRLLKD